MNITITSRKFKARESLKDFIDAEVKSLTKFYDDIMDAEVILFYQNSDTMIKGAELILKVPGKILTAKETSDEFEKATRSTVEKMERQLKKLKSKQHDHI